MKSSRPGRSAAMMTGFRSILGAVVATTLATGGVLPGLARPQGTGIWYVSRSPKLSVNVAGGCPSSIRGYADVVNTFPGPPLVPSGPSAGLICWYSPIPTAGHLARQTHLGTAQADLLVAAVRKLNLKKPTEDFHCPADFGIIAVIGISYPRRPDVGLWYQASGCQALDNGRLGAFQGANPSFYNGFESVMNKLSPPVNFHLARG